MCGITGIASKKAISGRRFYSAHKMLEHRGPDDEGFSSFNPQGDIVHLKGPRSIKNYQCLQSIVSAKCNEIILGHHRLKFNREDVLEMSMCHIKSDKVLTSSVCKSKVIVFVWLYEPVRNNPWRFKFSKHNLAYPTCQ